MSSCAGWDNHRDEGYIPYKYDENVARLPKDLLPAIPTAEANAPSGDRWTLAGSKYSSMLDEIIRTSSGLEDASRKTKKFIEEAIIANKLPSMEGLLKSMVQLTAEFASDEVRAAYKFDLTQYRTLLKVDFLKPLRQKSTHQRVNLLPRQGQRV